MARGRHRRPSGFLSWLLPRGRRAVAPLPPVRDELRRLEVEVLRLRGLSSTIGETAATALVRAGRAEDLAATAVSRTTAAERELAAARGELAGLRTDLASVREELVWAFAEGRLPARTSGDVPVVGAVPSVVDLREGTARTA